MFVEFYGPKIEAEDAINKLLNLPATGREQDWEIELADPARIDEMLDALETKEIDFDCQSALSLLVISSIDEANELGLLNEKQVRRAAELFFINSDLRDRMCFYWVHLARAKDINLT
ncbi:hypothetical protein [Arsukibacterium sp.]|uniref:hypothetical protein n=1 Tax=Arsukibacterium sp. TaxID=1977258 RepID=UPI002FDA279C